MTEYNVKCLQIGLGMGLVDAERLHSVLTGLHHSQPDIVACGLVGRNGLLLAASLPHNYAGEKAAALATTILGDCERICRELDRAQLQQVLLRGEDGYVILEHAGADTVLLVIAGRDPNLGMILMQMRRAAAELRSLLPT